VNISASIRELRGDLGATAKAYLMDGNTVIDVVNGLSIAPLGSASVVFSAVFQVVGTHQLKVVLGDVTPGDFDPSNNEKAFAIEVIQPPLEPVFSCLSYSYDGNDYKSVVETPYWISTYHQQYTNEYTSQTLYIPVALQSTMLGRVTLRIAADGVEKNTLEALNIPFNNYYNDGCYSYFSASQYFGDSTVLYVDSYQDCYGYQQTYASFTRSVSSAVYFSSYYDKYWGTTSTDLTTYGSGTFLNALNSLETRFVVEGDAGAFGGDLAIPSLSTFPYGYEWDYFDSFNPDYHYSGFYHDLSTSGNNCGVTTP
jgi:hypothetical protein